MNQQKIDPIIQRTRLLHEEVASHFATITPADGARNFVAFRSALLSIEYATGSLLLIRHDLSAPAYALLRSQYESLVRGIWLLYAASETWVEKLANPLSRENAERANEGLGLSEMLKQLENELASPKPIIAQLREYKEVSWKAMSSYTHGCPSLPASAPQANAATACRQLRLQETSFLGLTVRRFGTPSEVQFTLLES